MYLTSNITITLKPIFRNNNHTRNIGFIKVFPIFAMFFIYSFIRLQSVT